MDRNVIEKSSTDITDVIVQLDNGSKYIASFFSYKSIDDIRAKNMNNGEFVKGRYFWDKNMVLVEDCSEGTIEPVVQHLIDEGQFEDAFERL